MIQMLPRETPEKNANVLETQDRMESIAPRIEWHERPEFPISIYHNRGSGTDVLGIHCHDDFEILCISLGKAVFRIGSESYTVTAGDILFVNPYEFHSATAEVGEDIVYDAIVYERQMLESISLHPDYNRFVRPLLENILRIPHRLEKGTRISEQVHRLVLDILEEYREKPVGHEWMIRTHLERLAVLLYRQAPEPVAQRSELTAQQRLGRNLTPLFARIGVNPGLRISTRDAARIACMSPYHFCRSFKAYSGRTFLSFLNLFRVNEAERLLRDTTMTITEIAEKVGFCNIHYFDRVFRAYKGKAPGRIRKDTSLLKASPDDLPLLD